MVKREKDINFYQNDKTIYGYKLLEIVTGCLNNDNKYKELLYNYYWEDMIRIVVSYTKNKYDAEDILQNTFLKLYDNIYKYNFKGNFSGWFRKMVVYESINFLRLKQKTKTSINSELIEREESEEVFDNNFSEIRVKKILNALEKISPAYKRAFTLFIINNLTHKEIAEHLNISVSTSKTNLFTAKKKIKELISA